MAPREVAPLRDQSSEEGRVVYLLIPVVEGWRTLARTLGLVAAATLLYLFLSSPKFEASVTLAAVSTAKAPSELGDLAATLSGAIARSGLQASPALVDELFGFHGVLAAVGGSPMPDGSGRRIVDAIKRESGGRVRQDRVDETMREVIRTSTSDRTGLVTLRVLHRDSALARLVVNRLIDEARREFVAMTRAQASQLRIAQEARVDSASRQLQGAEREQAAFVGANRVVTPFSETALRQEALRRAVQLAQQVYTQAVSAREAAVAKELEQTPAMVVADPLPAVIPMYPRRRVVKLLLVLLATFLATSLYLVISDSQAAGHSRGDPGLRRLNAAVRELPVIGRLVKNPARSVGVGD